MYACSLEADFVPRSLLLTCFVFNSVDFKVLSRFFASLCSFKTSFLRSVLILLKNTVNIKMSSLKTVSYYDKWGLTSFMREQTCILGYLNNKFKERTTKGAFVWEYSGIRMYSGIYSGYSAPESRIARMESRYSRMRIAPKQTLTCIIPIILIPD